MSDSPRTVHHDNATLLVSLLGLQIVSNQESRVRREIIQGGMQAVNPVNDISSRLSRKAAKIVHTLSQYDTIRRYIAELVGYDPNAHYVSLKNYPDSDLIKFIRNSGRVMPEELVIKMLSEMGSVLAVMHDQGYVHRDIKPGCILVVWQGSDFHFRLTGFEAVSLPEENANSPGGGVTSEFWAPETWLHSEYSVKSDIFALAMTIMVALFSRFVSYGRYRYSQQERGWDDHVKCVCQTLALSPPVQHLLSRMLSEDQHARPTAKQTLDVVSSWGQPDIDDSLEEGNNLEMRAMT